MHFSALGTKSNLFSNETNLHLLSGLSSKCSNEEVFKRVSELGKMRMAQSLKILEK